MTARATFKQDDVRRATEGVKAAGLKVARVEVSPIDGRIVIITSEGEANGTANPWDDDLNG